MREEVTEWQRLGDSTMQGLEINLLIRWLGKLVTNLYLVQKKQSKFTK